MRKISFVIPCYRSEKTIENVVEACIATVFTRQDWNYEIILVNDGSPDNVWDVISGLAKKDHKIKGICLARNFGQHCALMAGYARCTGDVIISLDDDGQTPAEETFKLIDQLDIGYDVVYGYYQHAAQHWFRKFGSWVNKKMAETLIGQPSNLNTTSFFAAKAFIIQEISKYPNAFPYISGLVFRATKNLGNVEVKHKLRLQGKSGYTFKSLLALWINGFTAFSVKPLRIATWLGFFCAIVGLIFGVYIIAQKIIHPEILAGYTSMMAMMMFMGGVIMMILGLIGEYIGRIYISINRSPQYVVREIVENRNVDS